MSSSVSDVVEAALHLTPAERREILARLWPEQVLGDGGAVWKGVRFGEAVRVTAYDSRQEPFVEELRQFLTGGALARFEDEADGTWETYGARRTYYVTMTPKREFVALLSSWPPDRPPREIGLAENR